MPRNSTAVKAAKLLQGKSGAKLIKWETQEHSRGIRDVPVEVTAMTSQLRPRKMAHRQPRTEKNNMSQGETAPQPMDIDKTFWVEEPAMPTSKKSVRQPVFPFLANLTYLPALGRLHGRLYPQDWALSTLPPRFRGRSGDGYMPELQVCSVRVEVF